MESANSHHHHQDQLLGSSLPNYATPWPPSSLLNSNCLSETKQQANSSHASMEMGFSNWSNNHSDQDLQHYYRKYSDILSCGGGGGGGDEQTLRNQHQQQHSSDLQQNDVATKFLLKSFSSYGKMNSPDFYSGNSVNHTRQIFPAEYSSLINPAPGSLDMNLEALDLLASSRFTANFPAVAASHNQIGILRDEFSSYGLDQMHQSLQIPFYGSNKVSSASSNGVVTEAKRNTNKMEPKSQIQKPPKKSRLEARSSSIPPFKVRKEKLGDRIAALQQLVAPFGKTDTASVLMEAIGYIKFLQTQVETLSVPYMKASRNKTNRVTKGGAVDENGNYEEAKGDLKSRGLCLVPLSCLSYITDGGGGAAVWPPPHFGGAT